MPFTVQELENISNATLDFHMDRGTVYSQSIQNKPLLKAFDSKPKYFPAGKELLTVRVKGEYTTRIQGFSADDSVAYRNPANIKTASYSYKNIHAGIEVTYDELKKNGITVTETSNGRNTSNHSDREMTALANLLDDKLEDMEEGRSRDMNLMFWRDGSQDSQLAAGIKSFVVSDPTAALIVGGIDQSTNTWWRNRTALALSTTTPANQTIIKRIKTEMRQLKRYGNPKHQIFAGSDFLDALEAELRANGNYTLDGWANKGAIDINLEDVAIKGLVFNYDPTLDDEGESKYCYALDMNAIYPMWMEDEKNKRHSPARPHDKYVLYRAVTDTLGLVCRQRNTSGILSIQ